MSIFITEFERAGAAAGTLAGLTFAIKDNIDVAGIPTTAGCPAFAYTPDRDADVVERLLAAGATAKGKTNLDQFATGLVGVRTPHGALSSVFHPEYASGGSSSGSAIAVAKGLVNFSLGTDTAGSGRVPAAFNNIIGLKPTKGLLSMKGVVPACLSLDCVSIFARDLHTAKRALLVAACKPVQQHEAKTQFRFGVPTALEFFGDVEAEKLYEQAVTKLEAAGGARVEIDYAPFLETARLLYSGPWVAERYAAVGEFIEAHPNETHPVVRDIILGAKRYSAVDTFKAMYRLEELRAITAPVWDTIDTLCLPTTGTIYKIADIESNPVQLNNNLGYYTNFVNLLDLAALAIPAGFRPNGLPFGITLIGPAHSDLALLQLAASLDRIEVAVVGAHLSGQPLNFQLQERGATLLRTCKTASNYRLFALANTAPPKPGLLKEPGFQGAGIEVEVWSMPAREFGSFVGAIPGPLGIGTLMLADGSAVKGFICEPAGLAGAEDITAFGGWRKFRLAR